jgi:inorganic pyrophosphatase
MNKNIFIDNIWTIIVDRPMGSEHPTMGFMYPVNYGYVMDTKLPDGQELEAYVLGVFEPVDEFTGRCIALVQRSDDSFARLVIVPEDVNYTEEQIGALIEFQEQFFSSMIIRE